MSQSPKLEQLQKLSEQSKATKHAAEKVGNTLKHSAQLLVEAKESMIIAMLKEDLDIDLISTATKTSHEQVLHIKERLES